MNEITRQHSNFELAGTGGSQHALRLDAPTSAASLRAVDPAGDMARPVDRPGAAVEHFVDGAKPAVQQLSDSVAAAREVLHAMTGHWLQTCGSWTAGLRSAVQGRPLASVCSAIVMGLLIARLTR